MTGQESVAPSSGSAERVSPVLAGLGVEPGPLVVVIGYLNRDEADRLADIEAGLAQGAAHHLGVGLLLPAPPPPFGARFGTWLHVYATTQPTALTAALAALKEIN